MTRATASRKRKPSPPRAVFDRKAFAATLLRCASESDPELRVRLARTAMRTRPVPNEHGRSMLHGIIANALLESGDRAGARKEWLRMAALAPSPVRALIEAGLLAEADGKLQIAEEDYKKAARAAVAIAERAEAWSVLARFYVRSGQARRALPMLREKARNLSHPMITVAAAFVESRVRRDPAPLQRYEKTIRRFEREIPIFGYFLGFLDLWDGRTADAVRTLRGFVSRGVDAAATWGRELAPELDHARRTILQMEALARVQMP